MDAASLLAFNLALLAAMASPGPALLYLLRNSVGSGRKAGISTGLGLGLVAAGWTALALLGLDALFRLFPYLYAGFRTLGAVYLIWIAYGIWRNAAAPLAAAPSQRSHLVLGGMMVNLANPKSVLFAAAVLAVIFPATLSLTDKALIVANHLVVEVAVYAALATAISRPAISRSYLAAKPALDRITAGILGALGLKLLMDR